MNDRISAPFFKRAEWISSLPEADQLPAYRTLVADMLEAERAHPLAEAIAKIKVEAGLALQERNGPLKGWRWVVQDIVRTCGQALTPPIEDQRGKVDRLLRMTWAALRALSDLGPHSLRDDDVKMLAATTQHRAVSERLHPPSRAA